MSQAGHHKIKQARKFFAFGRNLTLAEWARYFGVSTGTFTARFNARRRRGLSIEAAILTPPKVKLPSRVGSNLKSGLRSPLDKSRKIPTNAAAEDYSQNDDSGLKCE